MHALIMVVGRLGADLERGMAPENTHPAPALRRNSRYNWASKHCSSSWRQNHATKCLRIVVRCVVGVSLHGSVRSLRHGCVQIVVFEREVSLRLAFFAMAEHGTVDLIGGCA